MLEFCSCFVKSGHSTELVHTEVVVRLCARAGLSEHSMPAATCALHVHCKMQRFFETQNAEISTERRFSNWTRIHSGGKPTSPGSDKQRDSAGELADQAAMMEHKN